MEKSKAIVDGRARELHINSPRGTLPHEEGAEAKDAPRRSHKVVGVMCQGNSPQRTVEVPAGPCGTSEFLHVGELGGRIALFFRRGEEDNQLVKWNLVVWFVGRTHQCDHDLSYLGMVGAEQIGQNQFVFRVME